MRRLRLLNPDKGVYTGALGFLIKPDRSRCSCLLVRSFIDLQFFGWRMAISSSFWNQIGRFFISRDHRVNKAWGRISEVLRVKKFGAGLNLPF
jgi:hypothetical protein